MLEEQRAVLSHGAIVVSTHGDACPRRPHTLRR
jgi:hypothetical protein